MHPEILLLLLLLLTGCSRPQSPRQATTSASTSTSGLVGLWMPSPEASSLRSTQKITEATCAGARSAGARVASVLQADQNKNVYLYAPGRARRPEDQLFASHAEGLEPVGATAADASGVHYKYNFALAGDQLAVDQLLAKDPGKRVHRLQFTRVTEAEAKEFYAAQDLCAAEHLDLDTLRLNARDLDASGKSPDLSAQISDGAAYKASCAYGADHASLTAAAAADASPGFSFTLANGARLDGQPIPLELGASAPAGTLKINLPGVAAGASLSGRCSLRAKPAAAGQLRARLDCPDALLSLPNEGERHSVKLEGSLLCGLASLAE